MRKRTQTEKVRNDEYVMGCAPSKESQEDPAEFCSKKSEKTPTVLEKLKQELKTHSDQTYSDVGRTRNPQEKQALHNFCPVPIISHQDLVASKPLASSTTKGVSPQGTKCDTMEGSELKDFAVRDRDGNEVRADIVFEKCIGKGAFGKVFQAEVKLGDEVPDDKYCLKICPVLNGQLTEIDILLKVWPLMQLFLFDFSW